MSRYKKQHTVLIATALALGVALTGCATPGTRSAADDEISAAQATLRNFERDPDMTWFQKNLKNARALIIAPQVTRAAVLVGGSGGEAVVLSRDRDRWTGPAFYKLGEGSVGLQVGADRSEVVILVMTEKARDALLTSSFKLGGDASIATGPVGAGASATVTTDLVSFSRSKGAFVGVSFEGAVIRPDVAANRVFYGQNVSPVDVLIRDSVRNPAAAPLQQSLRAAAR